jgi:hypothetical protein
MSVPTLSYDTTTPVLHDEATHTHSLLMANPLTAGLALTFGAIFEEWSIVNDHEIKLRTALVRIVALLAFRDTHLDGLVNETQQGVLIETKNDRKSPEFTRYFGPKSAYEVRKPFLGSQVETMRAWIPSLQASSSPILSDVGKRMEQAIAATDADVAAKAKLDQETRDFRTLGARKTFIDSFNALRKATYGKVSELPHANPKEHLPRSFAEAFFRHESTPRVAPATSEDLKKQIEAHQAQIAALETTLTQTLGDEAAAAKDKSDADAADAAIAQGQRELDEAAARLAGLIKAKKKT